MDYVRLVDGQLEIAPEVMYNEGEIIVNFNKNELLMKEYGFKLLVEDKPEYDERYQTLNVDRFEEQEDKIIAKYVVVDNDLDEEKEKLSLIHYNLAFKPWHFEDILYKEYFWEYAQKTEYFNRILEIKENYTEEEKFEDMESDKKLRALAQKECDCVGDDRKYRR